MGGVRVSDGDWTGAGRLRLPYIFFHLRMQAKTEDATVCRGACLRKRDIEIKYLQRLPLDFVKKYQ